MFFDACDGRNYTGLLHRYQNFVDLSNLLKADRAILVGSAPSEAAAATKYGSLLLRDGEPLAATGQRQLTVYRFVYPISKEP